MLLATKRGDKTGFQKFCHLKNGNGVLVFLFCAEMAGRHHPFSFPSNQSGEPMCPVVFTTYSPTLLCSPTSKGLFIFLFRIHGGAPSLHVYCDYMSVCI